MGWARHFLFLIILLPSFARAQTPSDAPSPPIPFAWPYPSDITPPKIFGLVNCPYPLDAVKSGSEGATILSFIVGKDGVTRDVTIDTSSGNPLLDEAGRNCILATRYKPAMKNGNPVEIYWKVREIWRLNALGRSMRRQ